MFISKDHVIYTMDKKNPPAAYCPSGAEVTFETCDCFHDSVQSEKDLISGIDFNHINPATGPLYIEGALPGHALKVDILAIDLQEQGATVAAPGLGRLADRIQKEETVIGHLQDGYLEFKGLSLPLRKMIGVIGTAPAGEGIATGTPHDHGGNMDCTMITEGVSLYLPVNVEGALLSLGDLHATMADGEVMGAGLEIAGQVRIRVEIIEDFPYGLPFVETEDRYITIASRPTMEEASDLAIHHMADLVMHKTGFSLEQAGMLVSLAADLKVCQIVDPNKTMRVEFKKGSLGIRSWA